MGLESGTAITDLVSTNPVAGDPKSEGDDHLRLIKTVLKTTFSLFNGPVLCDDDDLSALSAANTADAAVTAGSGWTAAGVRVMHVTRSVSLLYGQLVVNARPGANNPCMTLPAGYRPLVPMGSCATGYRDGIGLIQVGIDIATSGVVKIVMPSTLVGVVFDTNGDYILLSVPFRHA